MDRHRRPLRPEGLVRGGAASDPSSRALADRVADAASALRAVGAVRLVAHRGSGGRWPSRHAVRHCGLDHRGQPARNRAVWLVRGRDDRRQGRRVPAHRLRVRKSRRVRHHPQRVRLSAAHVQRSRHDTGGHHDPRVLIRSDHSCLQALRQRRRVRVDKRRRPTPGSALCRHHSPRHRNRPIRNPFESRRASVVLRTNPPR